jgi:drug/metabolite transporter (DMT)-like permease
MLRGRAGVVAALIGLHVIWGTPYPVAKLAFADFSPLALIGMRMSLASLLLLGLAALRGELWPPPAPRRVLLPMGLLGQGLYSATLYTCLSWTTASDAAIINAITPVATVGLAALFLGEAAGARRLAGAAVSLAGVAVVVVLAGSTTGGATAVARMAGDLGLLVCAVGFAGYTVTTKGVRVRSQVALLGYLLGIGSLLLIPLGILEVASGGRFQPTPGGLAALLYLTVVVYVVGFVTWASALRRLDAGQVGAFYNITPVVGVVLSGLLLGETITLWHVVAGALVLGGAWLAMADPGRGRPASARPLASAREP